jgi:hypothetical protein
MIVNLGVHLETVSVFTGISREIQNYLIDSVSSVMKNKQ